MSNNPKKDVKKLANRMTRKLMSFFRFEGIGKGKFNMFYFYTFSLIFFFLCYLFWFYFVRKTPY